MGIGDKQRIERERREKYAEAIWPGEWLPTDINLNEVDRVLAVADAEIEPLKDQIERDGERIAAQIAARTRLDRVERVLKRLRGSLDSLEAEGDYNPYEILRAVLDEAPEPEYTYAHMRKDTGYVYPDERWDTVEAATDALQGWLVPSAYVIVRRPKPQDWEEVQ